MKIFITGGTGFIGAHFIEVLLERLSATDTVFFLSRRRQPIDDKKIKYLIGDIVAIEKFSSQLLQSDYVFHLAANATFGSNMDYDSINYYPTIKIIDILKKSNRLKNFVFASTIGAMDRSSDDRCDKPLCIDNLPAPTSLYGKSKLKSEQYIQNSGCPHTILRLTWVYGSNMRNESHINKFASMVYHNHPLTHIRFPGKVSVIHIDNVADALASCINNKRVINKTYYASTEEVSIGNVFSILAKNIHKKHFWQIPIFSIRVFFSRIHPLLPILINNLFIDYLTAFSQEFIQDFGIRKIIPFTHGVKDVIKTNNAISGNWVITGANSGIGFELATLLDKNSKKIILVDKNIENLKAFRNSEVIKADLSKIENVIHLAERLNEKKIYCLINNAGIGYRRGIETITVEEINKTIFVNSIAPALLINRMIYNLKKNGAIIVNVSSSVSYNPLPFMSVYAASKAFLSVLSESITYELKNTNRVITVIPSGTYTKFQQNAGVKVEKGGNGLLSPQYVAARILRAVDKKNNIIILGKNAKIMLFITRFIPRRLNIILWGKLFEKYR